ncbi:hypothetical protein [Hyphobacterium marinum]|uniref:PASTA domain-containing protein n=1 Tax=Hyphobacterium marinum TaxID=3116574 RepID=A0ABU7LZL9_9PROT|nr:hypothetical protein [Hyphobacterium sp. Y6023]MEE2566988.1 hypothetical protein [Hyphobacterium sp. Y6023]
MLQALAIAIEWIALAGLTLLGIGYEPAQDACAALEAEALPIEYVGPQGTAAALYRDASWHVADPAACDTATQPEFLVPAEDEIILIRI